MESFFELNFRVIVLLGAFLCGTPLTYYVVKFMKYKNKREEAKDLRVFALIFGIPLGLIIFMLGYIAFRLLSGAE